MSCVLGESRGLSTHPGTSPVTRVAHQQHLEGIRHSPEGCAGGRASAICHVGQKATGRGAGASLPRGPASETRGGLGGLSCCLSAGAPRVQPQPGSSWRISGFLGFSESWFSPQFPSLAVSPAPWFPAIPHHSRCSSPGLPPSPDGFLLGLVPLAGRVVGGTFLVLRLCHQKGVRAHTFTCGFRELTAPVRPLGGLRLGARS